jgi:hypothetical protein
MQKEGQRIANNYFWMNGWGAEKIHRGLMNALGDSTSGIFQINLCLHGSKSAISSAAISHGPDDQS